MNILFIGRKNLNHPEDVSEEYDIYLGFKDMGEPCTFIEKNDALPEIPGLDIIFIAKTYSEKEEIFALRDAYPRAKIVYWIPDYQMITDTEGGFQRMVEQLDLFIGNVRQEQSWFKEHKIPYLYWPFDVACSIFQKEADPDVAKFHSQTPLPDIIPIGFAGNWSHNPWRANILREFQYYFRDHNVHVICLSLRETRERDDIRSVHYPLYGRKFNNLVALTKINLSMESMGNYGYWASRAARIMAAGGFALVWYCEGMEQSYGPDKQNLVYFRTAQEGIKLAEYYLEHEDERNMIAERGYQFANKNLRTINRVKELHESLRLRLLAS